MLNAFFRYFLLSAAPLWSMAQPLPANTGSAGTGSNVTDHLLILDSKKAMTPSEITIEGTPYLSPDFAPAFIRAKRGAFKDVPARYNACDDNLEYQQKGLTYMVMPSPTIKLVQFSDYSLVVDKLASRDSSFAFFIRLDSGRATLLSRKPVEFKAAVAPKAIQTDGKPPRYVSKQQEFYIKIGDELPRQFPNAKKLVELLPDHRPEVEKFLSSNKISKNAEDIKRLVAYYNSL
ncbi:MAG TPA: hypothetical protein VK658_12435 [Chryseolinea sp.]|nr:hypothetical protein [Chryseolinea sp.]